MYRTKMKWIVSLNDHDGQFCRCVPSFTSRCRMRTISWASLRVALCWPADSSGSKPKTINTRRREREKKLIRRLFSSDSNHLLQEKNVMRVNNGGPRKTCVGTFFFKWRGLESLSPLQGHPTRALNYTHSSKRLTTAPSVTHASKPQSAADNLN